MQLEREGALFQGIPAPGIGDDNLKFERERIRWPVFAIASLGVLINAVYFGVIFLAEPAGFGARFFDNLPESIFILSLIPIFAVVAFLSHEVVAGYRLGEYSRRLELEMETRNRQLVDLMNFNKNIMSSVNDLIFVIGSDGRFQFVGGNCREMLGCEPGNLVGRQFIELVEPGSVAKAVNNFESVLRGIEVPPYEIEVKGADGKSRYIEISSTSYHEGDTVSAQVGVARDVTERKKLGQHVIERNRELAALNAVAAAVGHSLELEDVMNAALEQVAALTRARQACLYLYDADERELELKAWKGSVVNEGKERVKLGEGAFGEAAASGIPVLLNSRDDPGKLATVTCSKSIAAVAAIPMRYRGRLVGLLALASGETDHFSRADIDLLRVASSQIAMAVENALLYREAQATAAELARSNQELARATDEISRLITAAEQERSFSVRSSNPHLVKCWEVKNCQQLNCPSYKSQNLRCWQVAGTHCGGEVQGVFAQKLGRCEKCEVYLAARPDRLTEIGEAFNNMMAMLEHRVEQQRQLQEQLIQSTKLAAIGELAANIAHEINNPLTGVLTHATLLARKLPENDPMAERLQTIANETLRARDIVRNLLDFSRKESLKRRKAAVSEVVEAALKLLRKQAELANVVVTLDFADDVPDVYVDVNQMKQIFINILNNAIHAMPGGGELTISIRSEKPDGRRPWVEVAFTDTGTGIPPEDLERVFDPFFTSKKEGEGTGLGLSISKRIAEEHGGGIEVESELGVGSTFTVKLPTANIATDIRRVA